MTIYQLKSDNIMIGLRLDGYDPDLHHDAAVAFVFIRAG